MWVYIKSIKSIGKADLHYLKATYDPTKQLEGHAPVLMSDNKAKYSITTNPENGLTIITESPIFPGAVNMGLLINAGTRDETDQTSGSCLLIKNSVVETLRFSETEHDERTMMICNDFLNIDYDKEKIFVSSQCIDHFTPEVLRMTFEAGLKQRDDSSLAYGMERNKNNHEVAASMEAEDPSANADEIMVSTAYGSNGLGMPSMGFSKNIEEGGRIDIERFFSENISPNKWVIAANNVKNHQEFVDMCNDRIGDLFRTETNPKQREKWVYTGGEWKIETELPITNLTIAFESGWWDDKIVPELFVMNTLIGSAQSFSVGGPGKGMYCRAITNLMQKYAFIDSANSKNLVFTDSGLFGMSITGSADHTKDILYLCLQELHRLREKINDVELERAKSILKMNILQSLERDEDRLEEMAKNYMTFGKLTFMNYLNDIDKITSESVNKLATKFCKGNPTVVAIGHGLDAIPSSSEINKMLNG